jgi:hypothetical protein
MKKIILKEQIQSDLDSLWANEQETEENSLSRTTESRWLTSETGGTLGKKADLGVNILKQTFSFLPGTLYLFFAAMFGFSYQFFWENPLTILIVFAIGSFLTIFGIGDLKNPKHLVIPVSIVSIGLLAYSLFSMFGALKYLFDYGIYFFPLALVVPFLARSFVERTDRSGETSHRYLQ